MHTFIVRALLRVLYAYGGHCTGSRSHQENGKRRPKCVADARVAEKQSMRTLARYGAIHTLPSLLPRDFQKISEFHICRETVGKRPSPCVPEVVLCMRRICLHRVCVRCFRGADTRDIRFSSVSPSFNSAIVFFPLRSLAKRVVYSDAFFFLLIFFVFRCCSRSPHNLHNPFEAVCSLRNILNSLDALLLAQIKKSSAFFFFLLLA